MSFIISVISVVNLINTSFRCYTQLKGLKPKTIEAYSRAICQEGLKLPLSYTETWVVDVKSVGTGEKALVYLGHYLYKGMIQEKDIIACKNGLNSHVVVSVL